MVRIGVKAFMTLKTFSWNAPVLSTECILKDVCSRRPWVCLDIQRKSDVEVPQRSNEAEDKRRLKPAGTETSITVGAIIFKWFTSKMSDV